MKYNQKNKSDKKNILKNRENFDGIIFFELLLIQNLISNRIFDLKKCKSNTFRLRNKKNKGDGSLKLKFASKKKDYFLKLVP